jgi:diaminopimelate epimerase
VPLRFHKVHGLGNDFVLIDARPSGELLSTQAARRLCERRTGIGADGVLTLLPPRVPGAAARLHIYNADGSEPEMCGNGLRCAAQLLLVEQGGGFVSVETPAGVLRCEAGADGTIRAELGRPSVGASIELAVLGETVRGLPVSIGNPHFVVFSPSASEGTARRLGPSLERHPHFGAARTNVELCAVEAASLRLFVWERGSGFTQACGTGACAAAVAAVSQGLLPAGSEIAVDLPGGRLHVSVAPDLSSVSLRGPAQRVYTGELSNEALGERA